MKILIIALLLIGCGTEDQTTELSTDGSDEYLARMDKDISFYMCLVSSDGIIHRQTEFLLENDIYFQACYGFRPCKKDDSGELILLKNHHSESEIYKYQQEVCT